MKKTVTVVMAGMIMLASCKSPEPALKTSEWGRIDKLDVKGRQGWLINEKLSFGDYRTVTLKRSWTKGSGAFAGWSMYKPGYQEIEKIIGIDYSQRRQSIKFEMADAHKNESAVFCVTKVKSANFIIGNHPNSVVNTVSSTLEIGDDWQNGFWVSIFTKEDSRPWEMVIDNNDAQRHRKSYVGFLALNKDTYYTIHPIYSIRNKKGDAVNIIAGSLGFEFRDASGKPAAAVSVIDKGVVYLDNSPAWERFLLANACAALLLQQQI